MTALSTHVLDTALGRPAAAVPVRLERITAGRAAEIGRARTDDDGRIGAFGPPLEPGTYRLVFDISAYFSERLSPADQSPVPPFFPEITVTFAVDGRDAHLHVPLLLSPFGYSTYRGS